MTPQQAAIAEKIPVLINVVFFSASFFGIFIFERCILLSQYTQYKNCQTIIEFFKNFFSKLLPQKPLSHHPLILKLTCPKILLEFSYLFAL